MKCSIEIWPYYSNFTTFTSQNPETGAWIAAKCYNRFSSMVDIICRSVFEGEPFAIYSSKLCALRFITEIKDYDCNSSYYKHEGLSFITSEL